MKRKTAAQRAPVQKKSVSKASAEHGREDSRAARIKQQKDARISHAQHHPDELAKVYAEREHDPDRKRKTHRREKKKAKEM